MMDRGRFSWPSDRRLSSLLSSTELGTVSPRHVGDFSYIIANVEEALSKAVKAEGSLLEQEESRKTRNIPTSSVSVSDLDTRLEEWESFGHHFEPSELEALKDSIAEMALSPVRDVANLYIGGLWALRRSDTLHARGITHVLSVVAFSPAGMKNFNDEPWEEYGKQFRHMVIDVDDVEESNLLVEMPRITRFIQGGLNARRNREIEDDAKPSSADSQQSGPGAVPLEKAVDELTLHPHQASHQGKGGVFVHCAAGKSRSATAVLAYLLSRHPTLFYSITSPQSRASTAKDAVQAALQHLRVTRPMVDPNDGFVAQLELWWQMGCPEDSVEEHPIYQKWLYKREVEESLAVGEAPSRLRFEDEERQPDQTQAGLNLRCKKCRRTLVTSTYIVPHAPRSSVSKRGKTTPGEECQHYFIEPLSWMRPALAKGEMSGRLTCPNEKCGAGVGRYDWKGFACSCGEWVTPGFSLQRARVDEARTGGPGGGGNGHGMGIRMPPGMVRSGGNL